MNKSILSKNVFFIYILNFFYTIKIGNHFKINMVNRKK